LAPDFVAVHVALQELVDVADGEDIRVYDHGAAFIVHEAGWCEAQRGERLEVLVEPGPLVTVAQVEVALALGHAGEIAHLDEAHVEGIRVGGALLQRVTADDGAEHLLVVGVDENGRFHGVWPRQ
jgi:hypothetical protein